MGGPSAPAVVPINMRVHHDAGHSFHRCRDKSSPGIGLRGQAFSLIELMIVISILAIASALLAPMLHNSDLGRLSGAAQMMAADLAYAQSESIAHADDLRLVVFDREHNTYRIAPASTPNTPITNPVGHLPYQTTFGQGRATHLAGITIQGYWLNGDDRIQFGAYGQLDQATAATVTLSTAGGKRITLTIDPTTGEAAIGAVQ